MARTYKVSYDNQNGKIKGFFPTDIEYTSIPSPNIEIDETQYQFCLEKNVKVENNSIIEIIPTESEILDKIKQQKIHKIRDIANSNPVVQFTKTGSTYSYSMETQDMIDFLQKTLNSINNNNFTLNFAIESNNTIKQVLLKRTEKANILTFLYQKIDILSSATINKTFNQYLYAGRTMNTGQSNIQNGTPLIFDRIIENNGIVYNSTTGKFLLKAGLVYEIYCNGLFIVTQKPNNQSMNANFRLVSDTKADTTYTGGGIFNINNSNNINLNDGFTGSFTAIYSPPTDEEFYIMAKGSNGWRVTMDWYQSSLIVKCIGNTRERLEISSNDVSQINNLTTVGEVENFTPSTPQIIIDFPETFINSVIL